MLPSRWFGRTFDVLYSNDPSQRTPIKVHLITSRDSFELISADWKTSFQRFRVSDLSGIESHGTSVVLTMSANHKFSSVTLNMRPKSPESLVQALTAVPIRPESTIALSPLLQNSQPDLIEETRSLLQTLGCDPPVNLVFVEAVACLVRCHLQEGQPEKPDTVICGFQRFMIGALSKAILRAVQKADSSNVVSFYGDIARGCARTIVKLAPALSIFVADLIDAIEKFPEGVGECAGRIRTEAENVVGKEAVMTSPHRQTGLQIVKQLVLTLLAAVTVGMYQVDCVAFSAKIFDFVTALQDQRKRDEATREVLAAQTRFLGMLLCFMDGRRCEEDFYWMFCVWPFRVAQ
jgi:hypothetical protein